MPPDAAAVLDRVLRRLAPWRVPLATYRVQFRKEFTFRQAAARIGYMRDLGVDTLYASPYLRARPESTHGYDVSDHNLLNPAVGDEADYEAMAAELRARGMGQLLDIVPNHMGIGEPSNRWWMDVLENGRSSPYADYFDIDWRPIAGEMRDQVLLAVLGDQYGRVLERGELQLAVDPAAGGFVVRYYETAFPVSPRSYSRVLEQVVERVAQPGTGVSGDGLIELQSILTGVRHLPSELRTDPASREEHAREAAVAKRRLAALVASEPAVAAALEAVVMRFNGQPGDPHSFDLLDELISQQPYRLAYWRVASEEINYRRFFDVNELAAIRMEKPEVFAATHQLILRLLAEGSVTSLRLDHPDGLWDPAGYFVRLQAAALLQLALREAGLDEATPELEAALRQALAAPDQARPIYVVAEKILAEGEQLPTAWAVDGTVGYEFMNALGRLFVDPRARRRFDRVYSQFVGAEFDFADLAYQCKKLIMQVSLASETNTLAHQLRRIAGMNRRYRDFTLYDLRGAVREVIACFPVYRTYVGEQDTRLSRRDRVYVERAIAEARRRNPATDASYFDFLRDLLLLRLDREADQGTRAAQRRFVLKFQQVTGPVAAKGVEDTAFYVYNRLVALNEVGGEPDHFGSTVEEFHRFNAARQRDWPHTLNGTSTHDTKRSEDVRARISVLSELPGEWEAALRRWTRLNRGKHRRVGGERAPDRNEEYLLYQTLLGAWPLDPPTGDARAAFAGRIVEYMRKATKEAKVNTSWINPNQAWDTAMTAFIEAVLADEAFLAAFLPLQRRVAYLGMYNALTQVLLKITSPGVPDIYQGQELWDFSLVDPDNRRPVDYDLRARALAALRATPAGREAELAQAMLASWPDGRIKLWLTHRALACRRDRPEVLRQGDYRPIAATGAHRTRVVAFARAAGDDAVVVVAPRLLARVVGESEEPPIGPAWGDTALALGGVVPPGRYRDVLTGESADLTGGLPLADLLRTLPLALLSRQAD